jgi:twitching motility protein PilT
MIAGLHPIIRVHGELKPLTEYERFKPEELKALLYSVLTPEQRESFEHHTQTRNELDFALGLPGVGRFRVNFHVQRGTMAANFRALSTVIPEMSELGLPASVRALTSAKRGLVLVTGPTGSGKSTTLAAMIDDINSTRSEHIITIEDPIEYVHNSKLSYVTQREVGPAGDTISFRNALKYSLRQDPDVILVGELRDHETIGIAITAAETGHLVFGTLHTATAAQTIDRLVDVFPIEQQPQIRSQLAINLNGVISQLLLPRHDLPGRVLACEVLICNFAVRNNIRMGKTEAIVQALQTGFQEGMQTMDQSLVKLYKEGKIDYETARPFIYEKSTHDALKTLLQAGARPAGAPGAGAAPRPSGPQAPGSPAASPRPPDNRPPWERKS